MPIKTGAIKKCSDCKFCHPSEEYDVTEKQWDFAKCHHPTSFAESDVQWHLGEKKIIYRYCSNVRGGACGKIATLFEPRGAQ